MVTQSYRSRMSISEALHISAQYAVSMGESECERERTQGMEGLQWEGVMGHNHLRAPAAAAAARARGFLLRKASIRATTV